MGALVFHSLHGCNEITLIALAFVTFFAHEIGLDEFDVPTVQHLENLRILGAGSIDAAVGKIGALLQVEVGVSTFHVHLQLHPDLLGLVDRVLVIILVPLLILDEAVLHHPGLESSLEALIVRVHLKQELALLLLLHDDV